MSQLLRLNARHSITDIEGHLRWLQHAPRDSDLLLPNRLQGRTFTGTAGVIQLAITWRRRCPQGSLRVYVQANDTPDQQASVLEGLVNSDHGLVAAVVAPRVVTTGGDRDITQAVRKRVSERLSQLGSFEKAHHGPTVLAACVDRTDFAFPSWIYSRPAPPVDLFDEPPAPVLGEHHWLALGEEMANSLWGGGRLANRSARDAEALGRFLYELFRNTEDHARRTASGQRYDRWSSIRGFRVERQSLAAGPHVPALEGDERALREYVAHAEVMSPQRDRLRIVSLDVFDSGPGLAAHLLYQRGHRSPSLEQEHRALHDCLAKHFTTRTGSPGIGLARVLDLVNGSRGLLRIRAGRLCLYRDFVSHPFRADDQQSKPFLLDWETGDDTPTELAHADGTLVSILLPWGNLPHDA